MVAGNDRDTGGHTVATFELLSVTPAPAGLQLVWAGERAGGGYVLSAEPCRMVGVARLTEREYAGGRLVGESDLGTEVVHLHLGCGKWHICEECADFGGVCFEGDDIYEATGELGFDSLDNLFRPDGTRFVEAVDDGDTIHKPSE